MHLMLILVSNGQYSFTLIWWRVLHCHR